MFTLFADRLARNWKSGLTVALVSIPLSISLAIASGAAPTAGIITAVWAGLIAAFFGGSNYNVIGPAGALSGILAAYALMHGPDTLSSIALIAGALVLIAWFFKLERFMVFVPGSTLHGFTLSVALVIALNQINSAFGLTGLTKHPEFLRNIWESLNHLGDASLPATFTFAGSLLLLFFLLKALPKVPGAIILAPLGILFGYLTTNGYFSFTLPTIGSTFPNLSSSLINVPHFVINQSILITSITVAFVAILETMLSAKITDGMTKTTYNERKEMLGLGLANLASGAAGGLPATGVLVRSALNAKTGATHKTSSGLNAVFVGIISVILFSWFEFLPMAAIAAILVFAAIRMVEGEHFVRYFRHDKTSFVLAMLVTAVSLYKDSTVGLIFGIAAALFVFMEKLSRGQFEMIDNDPAKGIMNTSQGEGMPQFHTADTDDHILVYSIKGQMAYINSQAHVTRFRAGLNGYEWVVLRLRELSFIDSDGIDALADIIDIIKENGRKVAISGINPSLEKVWEQIEEFKELKQEGLIFKKTEDALAAIRTIKGTTTQTEAALNYQDA